MRELTASFAGTVGFHIQRIEVCRPAGEVEEQNGVGRRSFAVFGVNWPQPVACCEAGQSEGSGRQKIPACRTIADLLRHQIACRSNHISQITAFSVSGND
jgi:hypothetical protein